MGKAVQPKVVFEGVTKNAEKVVINTTAEHKGGVVVQLFPQQADSINKSTPTLLRLNELFNLPTNAQELRKLQFARQQALLDAIQVFSASTAILESKPPIWAQPVMPMKQQQQRGTLISQTPQEAETIRERQHKTQQAILLRQM